MDRRSLPDAQWAKMQPHCRGKVSDPGRACWIPINWKNWQGSPIRRFFIG
jgi:hypothetical protein